MQFEECKKQLQKGDILMVMDFAQKLGSTRDRMKFKVPYWSRSQTTLHPIIIYYLCPEDCHHLICDEVIVISDDLVHDSFAVKAFMDRALEHLKEKNVPVEGIVLFSDNCSVQYKSCHVFDQMSQREIPILHNYFGSNYGKGDADSAIGHLSQHVDSVVRSGVIEISDSLFAYCKKSLK